MILLIESWNFILVSYEHELNWSISYSFMDSSQKYVDIF